MTTTIAKKEGKPRRRHSSYSNSKYRKQDNNMKSNEPKHPIAIEKKIDEKLFRVPGGIMTNCLSLKLIQQIWVMVRIMVFNANFNNISAISRLSAFFLVEETGVPGETTDLS